MVSGLENTDMYGQVEHMPIVKADKPPMAKLSQFDEMKETHINNLPEPKESTNPVKFELAINTNVTKKKYSIEEDRTIINENSQIDDLNKKVKTMIETNSNGFTCTVCGHDLGKKRRWLMVCHIETKNMNLAFPCVPCKSIKLYKSRKSLGKHMAFKHRSGGFK